MVPVVTCAATGYERTHSKTTELYANVFHRRDMVYLVASNQSSMREDWDFILCPEGHHVNSFVFKLCSRFLGSALPRAPFFPNQYSAAARPSSSAGSAS